MKAVVQRVRRAGVAVAGEDVARIEGGLLVLLGIARGDGEEDLHFLADKVCQLRIFEDDEGRMNRSLLETGGEMLVVSQFTLLADCRKGRRPSFFEAMAPEPANEMVAAFCRRVAATGIAVRQGVFGAMMDVDLVNAGPVTIILDSAVRRGR